MNMIVPYYGILEVFVAYSAFGMKICERSKLLHLLWSIGRSYEM